jgi:predicted RNase H-like HicB family nuclease
MVECSYTVLFEQSDEGDYIAFCPALPWIVVDGSNCEQAYERAKEALAGYLESLVAEGFPIPPDKKIVLKEEIRISLPERVWPQV